MSLSKLTVTYFGGPSALVEFAGARILTDPTFDPAGGEYTTGPVTLRKTAAPAVAAEAVDFEFVLLSHDHHFDNLDRTGRDPGDSVHGRGARSGGRTLEPDHDSGGWSGIQPMFSGGSDHPAALRRLAPLQ
jgi:hypothetical protein